MPLQWRTTWTSSLWSHFYTSMENATLEILFGKDYIYEYTSKIHDIEYLLGTVSGCIMKKKLLIWPLSSEILTSSHLTPPEILLNPYIRLLPGNSLSKNFQPISFLFKIICHIHQSPHPQSPHPQAPHPKSSCTPCLVTG